MKFVNKSFITILMATILTMIILLFSDFLNIESEEAAIIGLFVIVIIALIQFGLHYVLLFSLILLIVGRIICWNQESRIKAYKVFAVISIIILGFVDYVYLSFSISVSEDVFGIIYGIVLACFVIYSFIKVIVYKSVKIPYNTGIYHQQNQYIPNNQYYGTLYNQQNNQYNSYNNQYNLYNNKN